MNRVAFLWHMHQPMYVSAETGEAILPWVRFHATHAYYDMARMLERHPRVQATVNFVPCLVEQLEAAAAGTMPERYLEMTRRRPEEMSESERLFVVRQFFMVSRDRCVFPVPRYAELFRKRGDDGRNIDLTRFDDGDIRDIQLHFNLAWMGFAARADEPAVQRLLAKGARFDEADKAALLEAQQRVVRKVLPLWKKLATSGQVEISSTPYYHPILPLLCDSDTARRAMPDATLPPRFTHPEDAHSQVRLAIEKHRQTFGSNPTGMWPAEGSVSPEALAIFASEGIKWLATDEGNLFRSTPAPSGRGSIFQPWSCSTEKGSVALAFRDHSLSDRIGFTYARMKPELAVSDFLSQLDQAAADAKQAGLPSPMIPVILDGENAWEHYEGKGEAFLDALYTALEKSDRFKTVRMRDALSEPTGRLTQIHSGSWIDSNFRIWIGHPEDNLGWELLGQVRAMLAKHEQQGALEPRRLEEARRLLLQAEGSDWFWWYGDDFQTENAAEFDLLFRDRLIRAAELLGETPPARLSDPISGQASRQKARASVAQPPLTFISPKIDGRADSWVRWLGAGTYRPQGAHGAMYQSTRLISAIRYGRDRERFYLRLDPTESLNGTKLVLTLSVPLAAPWTAEIFLQKGPLKPVSDITGFAGAYDAVVELALPLARLNPLPDVEIGLSVQLLRDAAELERIPASETLPVPPFSSGNWSA